MKANVSEPTSYQRVIDIEIPEAELLSLCTEKQKKYRKEIKLPGFRQGKVPISIIESRFGDTIRAEAIDDLIQKSFRDSCEENKLNPISEAKIKDLKAEKGNPLKFSIEIEVDPEIEIKGYDKLKIKLNTKKIKPAEVDQTIEDLRERLAEHVDVDRPLKKGDLVTIEYNKVVIDGEERSDFKNPEYPIEIGSGQIKEFDEGLIGHSAGDVVEISFKFPKDYTEKDVAGKPGLFEIKVIKVQEKKVPEIDDEFLKKIGDYADEKALRESILKDLEARELDRAKNEAYDKAIETVIKDNPFDIPPARIEQYIDYMIEEAGRYRQPGQPEPSREEMSEKYHDTAVTVLKRLRIIDYIASKEKIKATQEEVDEQIRILAERYGQPFDTIKQTFRKNGTVNRIRSDIRERKTLDFMIGELKDPK